MTKSRNHALDLVRTVAIIMIVNFHLSYELESKGFFYSFRGVDWGSVGTAVFFILSGFALTLRYEGESPRYFKFLKGRFLSLYPMFYFTYVIAFAFYSIQVKSIAWGGALWRLVFTLFGADSWVGFFGIGSFYLVGEWFTFAIAVLYIFFPLLLRVLNGKPWVKALVTSVMLACYVLRVLAPIREIPKDACFETILLLFWTGMLLCKKRDFLGRYALAIGIVSAAAGAILFAFVHCDIVWFHDIIALAVFLALYALGTLIKSGSAVAKTLAWTSQISYAVYLWHHFVLRRIHSAVWTKMSSPLHTALYVLASYAVTFALAWITCRIFKMRKK